MRAVVTQRETVGSHDGLVDSLEREYVDFLVNLGFDVFPVSAFTRDVLGFCDAVSPDLVLLTGGGAIQAGAYRYDMDAPHQLERDSMEDELVRIALERSVALVGICRGMQKINAFFGGRVSSFNGLAVPRAIRKPHPVELADGERFAVNNFHVNGMFPADLGEGLQAIAFDPDNGTVEAMRHVTHRVLAVQWHPERMEAVEWGRVWFESELLKLVGN